MKDLGTQSTEMAPVQRPHPDLPFASGPSTAPTAPTRPIGVSGDRELSSGGLAQQALRSAQALLFPRRFRLLILLGLPLVSLFYLMDLYYPWPGYVTLSAADFLKIRALWVGTYLLFFLGSYFREEDRLLQRLRDYGLVLLSALFLGILSAHTGRLESPHYAGLMLFVLGRCLLLPGVLVRAAKVCAVMLVAWAAVACAWPAWQPGPPRFDGQALSNLCFLLGAVVLGLTGAYLTDRLALGLEEAKLLGRYRLGPRIGGGAMGDVYQAHHAALKRPCAVKILKEEFCLPEMLARFEREVEAASRLRHPNTIAIFDYGRTDDGRPYYVMEHLTGCDLRQLLEAEGPVAPERAVHFLSQAARSLAEAHALGLVHRDLKPGNLYVTQIAGERDFLKVLDFGMVRGAGLGPNLTKAGVVMGTPRYIAPEAYAGRQVDSRADVYALGVVGFRLLCGKAPFFSGNVKADIQRQLDEPAPPVLECRDPCLPPPSAELCGIVARCLEREPERRFGDAGALLGALEHTPEYGRHRPAIMPG